MLNNIKMAIFTLFAAYIIYDSGQQGMLTNGLPSQAVKGRELQ